MSPIRIVSYLIFLLLFSEHALAQGQPGGGVLTKGNMGNSLTCSSAVPSVCDVKNNIQIITTSPANPIPYNSTNDFSTLETNCTPAAECTVTLGQSAGNYFPPGHGLCVLNIGTGITTVTAPNAYFTGTITGTALAVSSVGGTIAIGQFVEGQGVLAGTRITAGSGTSWTINQSQTVTGVQMVSVALYGAPGSANGNPIMPNGALYMMQNGSACMQADPNNAYAVISYNPGLWFQSANVPVSVIQWTGLVGFKSYELKCSGVGPTTAGDPLGLEVAYGGTFQTTGYNMIRLRYAQGGGTAPVVEWPAGNGYAASASDPSGGTAIALTGSQLQGGTGANGNGSTIRAWITTTLNTGVGYEVAVMGQSRVMANSSTSESQTNFSGSGPYSTTAALSGIQIYNLGTGSTLVGMCSLAPDL